jgi:hypothetical protein
MITKDDVAKDLTHKSSGNGYAVVEFLPDGLCHVVTVTKDGIGAQVLKAWVKLMETTTFIDYDEKDTKKRNPKTVIRMLTPEQFSAAKKLSEELASGRCHIEKTRIVAC